MKTDGSLSAQEHYAKAGIEPITVIEEWNMDFHVGNALKYIVRSPFKGTAKLDCEKAVWYLRRRLALTDDLTGRKEMPAFSEPRYGAVDSILEAWSYLSPNLHFAVARLLVATTWLEWNDFAREIRQAMEAIEKECQ